MTQKNKILLLLTLLVVAGFLWGPRLITRFGSGNDFVRYPEGPRYYCESCGWYFAQAPGRLPPLKCTKCGRVAAARTLFGPGANGPDFLRCNQCQTVFPSQLWKWTEQDKARWEERLGQLGEGQFLSSAEVKQLNEGKLVKTSAHDWMPWADFQRLPSAEAAQVRCPKCGNTDPAQVGQAAAPTGSGSKN